MYWQLLTCGIDQHKLNWTLSSLSKVFSAFSPRTEKTHSDKDLDASKLFFKTKMKQWSAYHLILVDQYLFSLSSPFCSSESLCHYIDAFYLIFRAYELYIVFKIIKILYCFQKFLHKILIRKDKLILKHLYNPALTALSAEAINIFHCLCLGYKLGCWFLILKFLLLRSPVLMVKRLRSDTN